jgi:hypothetical protein
MTTRLDGMVGHLGITFTMHRESRQPSLKSHGSTASELAFTKSASASAPSALGRSRSFPGSSSAFPANIRPDQFGGSSGGVPTASDALSTPSGGSDGHCSRHPMRCSSKNRTRARRPIHCWRRPMHCSCHPIHCPSHPMHCWRHPMSIFSQPTGSVSRNWNLCPETRQSPPSPRPSLPGEGQSIAASPCGSVNPNGIPAQSPGSARRAYPGNDDRCDAQPQRGCGSTIMGWCNPVGDLCKSGARLCEPQHAPLEMKPLRVTDPRSVLRKATFAEISNGVEGFSHRITQGSSCLATLGSETESLWDSGGRNCGPFIRFCPTGVAL